MSTTINNHGPHPLAAASQSKGVNVGNTVSNAPAADNASSIKGANDRVALTDSARALTEAARADSGSPVDAAKVAHLRQSIANGSYQVNPGRIADGLLTLDKQIAGA